jgi:hypothetical protein
MAKSKCSQLFALCSSLLCLLALFATPAQAAVTDYIGRTIVEVHLESGAAELRDPRLLEIVDTRAGQPLAMADVRETLAHLFGLGRYQDIRVDAALTDAGVVLTYRLVPVQLVRRIAFQGSLQLPEDELRRAVVDRYGASPSLARARDAVTTLQAIYRDHGYPRAQISTQAEAAGEGDATLVFVVNPGVRARIGSIDVQGAPLDPIRTVLEKVGLKSGEPYDGVAVDARLLKYAEQLRAAALLRSAACAGAAFRRRRSDREPGAQRGARAPRRDRFRGRPVNGARAGRAGALSCASIPWTRTSSRTPSSASRGITGAGATAARARIIGAIPPAAC